MDNVLHLIFSFAKTHHSADCSGHGFDHINRVHENALLLLREYPKADAFIVRSAALLHDVDDRKMGTDGRIAADYLNTLSIDKKTKQHILDIINRIAFSTTGTTPNFSDIETKIIFDADKLDAMGAMGINRSMMYGIKSGRPFFDPDIFPTQNLSVAEYKNENRHEETTINHFFDKLLKLKKLMQTDVGQREAQKRHQFMVEYLTQFFKEEHQQKWIDFLNDYLKKEYP